MFCILTHMHTHTHVHTHMYACVYILCTLTLLDYSGFVMDIAINTYLRLRPNACTVYMYIHVTESWRTKKERSKQGQTNNKAKQRSTLKAVTLYMYIVCTLYCTTYVHV